MNWDSWIALVALLLALAGLALQWKRGHSKLKIVVQQSIPVYQGRPSEEMMLGITVQNQRYTATQIRKLWIPLPTGECMFFPDIIGEKALPCNLGPFESTTFLTPLIEIAVAFKQRGCSSNTRIRAVVEDGSGHTFCGSKKIDVGDWGNP